MKNNYTEIIIILDESGSMYNVKDDTIGGFNQFLNDQKKLKGKAYITLTKFNSSYFNEYNGIDINEVEELNSSNYVPNGCTALYDAIGSTIMLTNNRLEKLKKSKKPSKVICVIMTDGEENSSREFDSGKIKKMIKKQKENFNWEFVFLGANQDAFKTGQWFGFDQSSILNYTSDRIGTRNAFYSVSKGISKRRNGDLMSNYFDEEDIKLQNN